LEAKKLANTLRSSRLSQALAQGVPDEPQRGTPSWSGI
jgi:hypothetical protein